MFCVRVPQDLRKQFHLATKKKRRQSSEVIREMMARYVRRNGK